MADETTALPITPPEVLGAFEARNLKLDEQAMTIGFDLAMYKADDNDVATLDPGGQRIEERVVGPWLFRMQTVWQRQEAGVEFARLMRGVDPGTASLYTVQLALARAQLPPLLVSGPAGWDWDRIYAKDARTVRGVWHMFTTHTERF